MKNFTDYLLPHLRYLSAVPAPPETAVAARLDRNESPFNTPDNRYPAADFTETLHRWGKPEGVPPECVCLCCGTEHATDLTLRLFCRDGKDGIVVPAPSRSVYGRRARLAGLRCAQAALERETFALNPRKMLAAGGGAKVAFVCHPNNPTGNLMETEAIETLLEEFDGMVVVDESYIDFAPSASVLRLLNRHSNLVVFRSFSHAWASAGVRLAAVVARPELIACYKAAGYSHPVSAPCAAYLSGLVDNRLDVDKWTRQTVEEREKVVLALAPLKVCLKVYPSSANFILIKVKSPARLRKYLLSEGVAVCLCAAEGVTEGFLRVTIGLPGENSRFIGAMRRFDP